MIALAKETTMGRTPTPSTRPQQLAAQTLVNQLLVVYADLVDARAVARAHGLTRCTEQLARQSGEIRAEIGALITDIMAPTGRRMEELP